MDDGVAIARHRGIMSNQAHWFNQSLGHQQAVKRVLVVRWESLDSYRMLRLDTKEAIPRLPKIAQRIVAGNWHIAPAQTMLNGDFP